MGKLGNYVINLAHILQALAQIEIICIKFNPHFVFSLIFVRMCGKNHLYHL